VPSLLLCAVLPGGGVDVWSALDDSGAAALYKHGPCVGCSSWPLWSKAGVHGEPDWPGQGGLWCRSVKVSEMSNMLTVCSSPAFEGILRP
jgi:hypothetical protein